MILCKLKKAKWVKFLFSIDVLTFVSRIKPARLLSGLIESKTADTTNLRLTLVLTSSQMETFRVDGKLMHICLLHPVCLSKVTQRGLFRGTKWQFLCFDFNLRSKKARSRNSRKSIIECEQMSLRQKIISSFAQIASRTKGRTFQGQCFSFCSVDNTVFVVNMH